MGRICFSIGGFDESYLPISSVSRYNIIKDSWEIGTPDLQIARASASACSLGDNVFVFAGSGTDYVSLNSVERIKVSESGNSGNVWELI